MPTSVAGQKIIFNFKKATKGKSTEALPLILHISIFEINCENFECSDWRLDFVSMLYEHQKSKKSKFKQNWYFLKII